MDTNITTKRPTVVTIAAILLIVLSLIVTGLGLASQFGLLGRTGFGNRQFAPGQFRNRSNNPQGSLPQGGFPQGGFPQGGFSNNQNGTGTTPTFTPNAQFGSGIGQLFRLLRPVTLGLDLLVLVLSFIAAIGLFMNKRWASVMAIVISALVILLTIPSMLRIFSTITLAENLLRILMAVAVIVLLLLPSARKTYMVSSSSSEEEVDRVVR